MGGQTGGTFSRRRFLSLLAAAGAGQFAVAALASAATDLIKPVLIDNPLAHYPNRDWEKVYRDLYRHDSVFTFLCAPNDTHNCLLNAYVKNGVVTRIAPSYAFHRAEDLDGRKASRRWEPRCCQKGLALVRRIYGDRRVKGAMVRQGFLEWADAGFPRNADGSVPTRYLQRGKEPFVRVAWEQAFALSARALVDIARTYSGDEGTERLREQGYDPLMCDATGGAGTQVLKIRGSMPALGMTRIFGMYRLANSLALLDAGIRKVPKERALGARVWDSYAWHTDLPPGHPMVTGMQTNDFDLCLVERAKLVVVWGMNWISTKMPDSHWLTEARMKGTRVVVVACEYSSTACKGDDVLIVRPGTTPALALGFAQVIIAEKLYDETFVRSFTDLPLLIRVDTGEMLRARDVFRDHRDATLANNTTVLPAGAKAKPIHQQDGPVITESQRAAWGDLVALRADGSPVAVSRDQIGDHAHPLGDVRLDAATTLTLVDGSRVECITVFRATRELLDASYTPDDVAAITWAPADAIRTLARAIAASGGSTLFACGMGPNQFFNSDQKDRSVFLVAALTGSIGRDGGNVGSYAGNFRAAFLNGLPAYYAEDPFDLQLDPSGAVHKKSYYRGESAHFFNSGDRILRMGKAVLTGKTHLPTPTKAIMVSNGNSLLGNAKGHYDVVMNGLPRVDLVTVADWWWTGSCEYADIVFGVDSWAEFKYPDLTISVTNPFLYTFPATPLPRIHDTRGDIEVLAGIGKALADTSGDQRFADCWRFIGEGQARPYLQRILDHSSDARGFRIEQLEERAAKGTPAIVQARTYPKYSSWEQVHESKPWYTKSGRLEFYREEPEFRDSGENMTVHREPIDSTFHEPGVLVAKPHPLLRPKGPEAYGVAAADRSSDTRQARHVVMTVAELLASKHPLAGDGWSFVFHTPKYRHGAHTMPIDTDITAVWFGPFGDLHRHDKRSPFVTEGYVDINPLDAKALGVEDGDYVWIDADPAERPFRGWQKRPDDHRLARLIARARYYPGTPRGVTRMWYNMYGASYGSMRGAESRADGLAKSPTTGFQAMFRSGSHQSCTRGWLKPTWLTDTLVVKSLMGQEITQGFVLDVHGAIGAPRESFVRIQRAEPGGIGGGLWRPAALGLRPTYENDTLKRHLAGGFARMG